MRPITLRRITKLLSNIGSGKYDMSGNEELHDFAKRIGLINEFGLTRDGEELLELIKEGRVNELHRFFSKKIVEYKIIYDLYTKGLVSPALLSKESGLNLLVVDVVVRLITEIEQLSSTSSVLLDNLFDPFKQEFEKTYWKLVRRYRSRYIPLYELIHELRREFPVPSAMLSKLLLLLKHRCKGRVNFVQAPLRKSTSAKGILIGNKRYSFVILYKSLA